MSCLSLMLAISMHIGLTGDYNNIHPHARCQQDSLISGVYYNSEENVSAYIGMTQNGWELGLVTTNFRSRCNTKNLFRKFCRYWRASTTHRRSR